MSAAGRLDSWLFHLVNDQAGKSALADAVLEFGASRMEFVLVLTAILGVGVITGLDVVRNRRFRLKVAQGVVLAGTAVALALALNAMIGQMWARPRPHDSETVRLLIAASADPSLPSDHAAAAIAIVLGAWSISPALGATLLAEAFFVVLGRVYVGVHYPGDILAGVGTALAGFVGGGVLVRRWQVTCAACMRAIWTRLQVERIGIRLA